MTPAPPLAPSPERTLVSRLVAGDECALGELYDRYGGMAHSLACAIVSESEDAEDVVAEAFAQMWRSAERLHEPLGPVKTRMRAGMDELRQHLRALVEVPS